MRIRRMTMGKGLLPLRQELDSMVAVRVLIGCPVCS